MFKWLKNKNCADLVIAFYSNAFIVVTSVRPKSGWVSSILFSKLSYCSVRALIEIFGTF